MLKKIAIVLLLTISFTIGLNSNKIYSLFRIPERINIEHFDVEESVIVRVSSIKGIGRVWVNTTYGEYEIVDSNYYQKYYGKEGTLVIAKLKKDIYDNGRYDIIMYGIEDIQKEGD